MAYRLVLPLGAGVGCFVLVEPIIETIIYVSLIVAAVLVPIARAARPRPAPVIYINYGIRWPKKKPRRTNKSTVDAEPKRRGVPMEARLTPRLPDWLYRDLCAGIMGTYKGRQDGLDAADAVSPVSAGPYEPSAPATTARDAASMPAPALAPAPTPAPAPVPPSEQPPVLVFKVENVVPTSATAALPTLEPFPAQDQPAPARRNARDPVARAAKPERRQRRGPRAVAHDTQPVDDDLGELNWDSTAMEQAQLELARILEARMRL